MPETRIEEVQCVNFSVAYTHTHMHFGLKMGSIKSLNPKPLKKSKDNIPRAHEEYQLEKPLDPIPPTRPHFAGAPAYTKTLERIILRQQHT
jgi:hypothetical protein